MHSGPASRPSRTLRRPLLLLFITACIAAAGGWVFTHVNTNPAHTPGEAIDSLNGTVVYYNGGMTHVAGRNTTADGYNLGLRWQCVEFIKRYYFERFTHRMPETRGNARDFFDAQTRDGELNRARALTQFTNGGGNLPQADDIIVFKPWFFNPYGHVAIVARAEPQGMEIIQQNPGPFGASREWIVFGVKDGRPVVEATRVIGWLRYPAPATAVAPTAAPVTTP